MAGDLNLSNLKPAQARQDRKRVGRGMGSGKGRYSGRGIKGQKSRAGSHTMRAGFEGGQMPKYMRMGKQRGATSKDAMPIGPFRTSVWSVNVRDLERRFDAGAEVTPEALVEAGLIRNLRRDVKILGHGDLSAEADRLRARVLQERGREDRGRRRQRHLAEASARAEEAPAQEGRAARRPRPTGRDRGRGRGRSSPKTSPNRSPRPQRSRREEPRPRLVLSWLANAWRVPELRRRVLFTAMILALYRLGSFIPAPGVNSDQITSYFNNQGGTVLGLLNLFSGNALSPLLDLRARDHAVHHGLDHPAAPGRRRPHARPAPEGGRGRATPRSTSTRAT